MRTESMPNNVDGIGICVCRTTVTVPFLQIMKSNIFASRPYSRRWLVFGLSFPKWHGNHISRMSLTDTVEITDN